MKFSEKPYLNDYGEIVVGHKDGRREYYYEIIERNARITKVKLDKERMITCWMTLEWSGAGQGFGGWHLGGPFLSLWVTGILDVLGLEDWDRVSGSLCRIRNSHDKIFQLGHITEDRWFDPEDMTEKAVAECKLFLKHQEEKNAKK